MIFFMPLRGLLLVVPVTRNRCQVSCVERAELAFDSKMGISWISYLLWRYYIHMYFVTVPSCPACLCMVDRSRLILPRILFRS